MISKDIDKTIWKPNILFNNRRRDNMNNKPKSDDEQAKKDLIEKNKRRIPKGYERRNKG